MAIAPIQITMAIDFDQSEQATTCQNSPSRIPETGGKKTGGECAPEYSVNCVDFSVCGVQTSLSSFYSLNSFLLVARTETHQKIIADSGAVSTQYPEILRRPPKV